MRQEELKGNPLGNMRDASNRGEHGFLIDLVNSLGWKGTGIVILVIIVGYIIISFFY